MSMKSMNLMNGKFLTRKDMGELGCGGIFLPLCGDVD